MFADELATWNRWRMKEGRNRKQRKQDEKKGSIVDWKKNRSPV